MNPLQPIYDECNTGNPMEKMKNLPDFPRMVDIEPTSSCNFRCLMCPTGNLSLERPAGFMEVRTFLKIANECWMHDAAIRFIGWGEPLLHPKIVEFIGLASKTMGLKTHLNTNGSKITEDLAEKLVNSGLSSIKFSFQGVDKESYAEMRNTDFFDGMLESISLVKAARKDSETPFIAASTTTTDENEERVAAFKEKMTPLVDCLSIGRTVFDFMDLKAVRLKQKYRIRELAQLPSEKKHPVPCPEVFDKLSIHYDGSARVCCNDFNGTTDLGNVNDSPLSEIWRHKQIEDYRKRLSKKEYSGPLCSVCWDYMAVTG